MSFARKPSCLVLCRMHERIRLSLSFGTGCSAECVRCRCDCWVVVANGFCRALVFIALLSALAHFSIKVTRPIKASRRIVMDGNIGAAAALCVFAWVFILVLACVVPGWAQINLSLSKKAPVRRMSASRPAFAQIPYLALGCPSVAADTGGFYYTELKDPSADDEHGKSTRPSIKIAAQLENNKGLIALSEFKALGFYNMECLVQSLADFACADIFQRCRQWDCISLDLVHKKKYELVDIAFKETCVVSKTEQEHVEAGTDPK